MWQQAGRAGRRDTDSLAVLVAQDDPLDQYLVHHPEDLFDKPAEAAVIDPTNPYVREPHPALRRTGGAAARRRARVLRRREEVRASVEAMTSRGELVRRREAWHDRGRDEPHRAVDVRAGGGHVYSIVIDGTGELLGTADEHRAYATLHPGAVYLHLGEQYLVQELDLVSRIAVVRNADPDFYTRLGDVTDIAIREIPAQSTIGDVVQYFGSVSVTNQVVSYVRKSVSTNETLDEFPLPLPPVELETRAVWWTIPQTVLDRAGVGPRDVAGAILRGGACRDRAAAPRRDLRPMGHRRRLDADAPRHRRHHDLHLRRLPGRGRHHAARRDDQRAVADGDARGEQQPLHARVPELRPEPEVRQRQRAARQAGGRRAAGGVPRGALGLGRRAGGGAEFR